ncbi:type II toxin-antitoxin system death-on-curing family toxin [Megasphaera sp. ASD88]|uniref:type II toxin-antitoxin system death-on-curing family toxin n=1 Tax=Megasphaera TaxID=906 RepID=UPI0008225B68|nr:MULTISPECIES: type II toxin-antitoxin system death-on-curing family toxin [Megasphaera]MDN0047320.1 type II toxin-antitoxin system death-on-curing family toxin [Megasphaera hexanoica]SCJ48021.1 death-on-curing family protein [uncultured Ruminococcus sp.]MBM6733564.1 type II toxin-antitoxin system death-on-curing family toxin [Megasphaera stantonii]MCU6715030.1 type II toxin-antitoxin system death-on-curing family toxin [Megasphaera butyrica]NJE35207.1 type II toxin-antitoxin system death-on
MSTEKDTIAIILDDVLAFHKQMEKNFVMDKGIHDMGLLESAVSTPFQTFGGQELYPSLLDKAARLCYGLAKNHPFRDGNKRSAVHSMLVFLYINEIELEYTQLELEEMIIAVADNRMSSDELKDWIEKRIQKK